MTITKRIEIDGYIFHLSLESKSLEAHSMMSDEKVIFEKQLDLLTSKGHDFRDLMNMLVDRHRKMKTP